MRKATLYLIVAAITLWAGTVAWSMPQEKKPEANSKSSGHATEKANSTDQASDDAQQSDDASSKDATIKRKKQPRDKENDSSVQPAGSEGIGSQAEENCGLCKDKTTRGATTNHVTTGDMNRDGRQDLQAAPPAKGRESSAPSVSDGVAPNPKSGSGGGGGGGSATGRESPTLLSLPSPPAKPAKDVQAGQPTGIGSQSSENAGSNKSKSGATPSTGGGGGGVMTEKVTLHHEGMAVEPPPETHDRESSQPSVSEGVMQNPNSGSGGGGGGGAAKGRESPTLNTIRYPTSKPVTDVQAAPGGEENPKETVEYKDGEDKTTRIRKRPDILIADPPNSNSTTGRESPSKGTLGATSIKQSKDVAPDSGGAPAPEGAVTFGREKLKATTKTQGDFNLSNRNEKLLRPKETDSVTDATSGTAERDKPTTKTQGDFNLSNRTSGGGEENPKESVTTPDGTSGAKEIKRKDGAIHSADFRSSGGDNHETVEYKDPEDMTTRGLTKPPPPPPGGPGGVDDASKHKNNMSGAQSNPMYKESKKEGTNPLYEGKDGVAPPDSSGGGAPDAQRMKNAGDYNLSHKFSVEISGKAGKDQNGVTGGEENPKETVTGSSDAEKQKRPGRPAYGNISMQKQGAPTGEENPKETVTQSDSSGRKGYEYYKAQSDMSAKEKKGNTLCGTTDHLRECKPGETPTVTDTSGGTGSDSATAKKKPHEPPPNISDGAAKGQAQEGVAPNPNSGDSGNAAGGTPASPK